MAATKVRGNGRNRQPPPHRRRQVTIMSVACVGCFALHSIMIYAIAQRITVAAIAVVSVGGMPIAWAQDASGWDGELHAAARLIGGAAPSTKLLRAGLEIRLDPGWKTYWRYPGDSGVPPTFDFAGSQNVRSVTTLWPAPKRFADGAGGQSVGYFGDVVLPLTIVPEDASKPASLRVKLGYAICANLCVPAEADLDLTLSGRPGAEEPALVAAEARVPRRVPLGATDERGGLAVRSVHREAGGAQARVVVEIAAPESAPVDLFVEGPTPDWALPLPEPAGGAPGMRRFTFVLDGLPPGAHAEGAMLTLTAVSPNDAIEVEAHLD
jgi:DsbC/DsbD-like thiol-disulfide interchange protein